jgi:uncharacterized protein YbaR (Trm112 family)
MFIELTDHLRCPADHDESNLVLLPDTIEDRSVRSGQLGCPVCGRTFLIADGVFDTGDGPHPDSASPRSSGLTPDAVHTLVGLSGPGGYLVLVGSVAGLWEEIGALNPGVALVAINPPPELADRTGVSVIRSGGIPLRSRSMRGVVLSRPYGEEERWVDEAARVVLPGLRLVGEGNEPPANIVDLMASAGGVWVGTGKGKSVSGKR